MVDKMENDLRKFVWLKGVRVGYRNGEIEGGASESPRCSERYSANLGVRS